LTFACQNKNYVDIGHAQNIIIVELVLLCLGQIRSCDNLTLGKAYGIIYGVHGTSPYIYIYIYIITTFWFLMLRTQLAISHTFSKWAPVSLQVICQSPLLELLGLSSFWLWSNFLKAFDWLQWVRFCISWWA
jgi:hypothetical protein